MAIIIGSARIDENGNAAGGVAGDQKQTSSVHDRTGEVSMQDFYVHSKGWYILRPKDASVANAMAALMKKACNNKNIGYDQDNRLGVIRYGIDTSVKTECDCGTLVRECIKEATGKDVGDFYTGNEADVLENSGLFEKRISFVSLSKTPIYTGDVLVTKKKGHTVIVVSGTPRGNTTQSGSSGSTNNTGGKYMFEVGSLVKDDSGKTVKLLQRLLIGHGYSVGQTGADGHFGDATEEGVKKFQKEKGISVNFPGTVGSKTWAKLIDVK